MTLRGGFAHDVFVGKPGFPGKTMPDLALPAPVAKLIPAIKTIHLPHRLVVAHNKRSYASGITSSSATSRHDVIDSFALSGRPEAWRRGGSWGLISPAHGAPRDVGLDEGVCGSVRKSLRLPGDRGLQRQSALEAKARSLGFRTTHDLVNQ